MGIKIDINTVGPFAMNAMVVYEEETKRGFLLDPGDEVPALLQRVKELGVKIEALVFSHGHLDHVYFAEDVRKALKLPTYLHKDDWEMPPKLPSRPCFSASRPVPS